MFCKIVKVFYTDHIFVQIFRENKWIRGTFLLNHFEIGPLALEEMSLKSFPIFSSGGHFVQSSGMILAIWWRAISGTFLWNYFEIGLLAQEDMSFFFLFLALAISVVGQPSNILVKMFWNQTTSFGGDVAGVKIDRIFFFFLFLALMAISFSEAERFKQFW